MKVYKAKTLIDGFRLGCKYIGKTYVAVPQLKADGSYYIAFNNSLMSITGIEPIKRLKFSDKYGRKDYWLYYYEWLGKIPTISKNFLTNN